MNDSQGSEFGENPWFSLTDSQTELAMARLRLSELERHCLDEFLASTSIPHFADQQTLAIIRKHYSYAAGKLAGLLKCEQVTEKAVSAALTLCSLGEQSGLDFVTLVLRMSATDDRDRILVYLTSFASIAGEREWNSLREFLAADPKFLQAVSDLLNDEDTDTVLYAIRLCHQLQLENVLGQFREMLKSDKTTELQRLALLECLTDVELTSDMFEASLEFFKAQEQSNGAFLPSVAEDVLLKFAISADDSMKSRACDCLRELVTLWLDRGETSLHGVGVYTILDTLCESSGTSDIQWLRRVATETTGVYSRAPLVALIRISPQEGRAILLDWLADRDRVKIALGAARDAYYDTADKELLSILRSIAERATPGFLRWVFDTIQCIGGQAAVDENRDLLERLPRSESEYFRSRPDLCDPKTLIPALEASRVIPPAAIGVLKNREETEHKFNGDQNMDFLAFFITAGCCAAFDLATIQTSSAVPRPAKRIHLVSSYQWILGGFAAASCGLFSPENILVDLKERDQSESPDWLEVTFIHGNRLYKGLMRGKYDFQRACKMINSVLLDQGSPFQFVRLAQLNSFISFLFVQPDALTAVAKEFDAEIRYDTEHMKPDRD